MNYKCKNENLKIKNLATGFLERMPMNVSAKFVKFSRDKAIVMVGKDKYILDRFMFEQWFEKV